MQQVHLGQRRIISAAKYPSRLDKVMYGRRELDSNADITVAWVNYCIFQYTRNSVVYHHIVMIMKLSKLYEYYMQKLLGSHQSS